MRKNGLILLLALCLCLMAACSGQSAEKTPTAAPLPTMAATEAPAEETQEPEEPDVDDSGTDLYMPDEEGFVDDSGTDIPGAAVDYTAMEAEQCVEDALPEPGVLPRIVLDCDGARAINEQLESQFAPLAEDPACEGMSYECNKAAGRVLSVLMMVHGPNDTVSYTPFNLDLATGEALTGGELLALLEVDTAELANLEQAVLGEEFTHQYGMAEDQTDAAFYQEQYDRTTAPDNAETERVWMGGDGQLYFVGRIYALAGAESYEYILGSTLFF